MDSVDAQTQALRIAGELIDAGIPVFAAPPCPGAACPRKGHENGKTEFDLPAKWQLTVPSRTWLQRWQPGWALAAVGGHAADFLDEDSRHGGSESIDEMRAAGQMPNVFGVQATPSGGFHYLISPLHERETNAFMPGLDYQGGMPDGKGRAFVWIAPTVRRSKSEPYESVAYQWLQPPDLAYLSEFESGDDSIEGLRDRILSRKVKAPGNERKPDMEQRLFTEQEAQRFCSITLERLEQAEPGGIETAANNAATQLSHFVPEFWSEAFAYDVLSIALGMTKYDPDHPASGWTAEKFHDVIAGVDGRAPSDWEAKRKPATVDEVAPQVDAVDALLAEMLTADQLQDRPAPAPLIKGLLNLDSVAWTIGAPGSKKSFVVLDQAAHVVRGMDWQGMRVTRGPAVIIAAEGASGMSTRVKAWQLEHGRIGDDLLVLPRPVQASDLEGWAVLREACRRLKPVLVVIDTQARVTVGLEENSARDMGVFIEAAESIRRATGACVNVVHHTGRSGGDARGSSAIDGAQGTELKVVRQDAMTGVLKVEKQKDLTEMADIPLYFKRVVTGVDEDGDEISSLVLTEGSAFQRAMGGADPDEWQAASISVTQMVLTVLGDHGLGRGITKAEAFGLVIERFYGGEKGRLNKATWHTSWNRALERDGVIGVGDARFTLDPLAPE